MNGYDYLNARVRGMSVDLLTPAHYNQFLGLEREEQLIDALLASPYGPQLRETLAARRGPAAVESALRRNIFETFAKLRLIAPPEPRRVLNTQFNQWDAANVLAVVRGKVTGAPPEEILRGVLPAGQFDEAQLAELAAEPDVPSVANALTTWGYPLAFELRRAIRQTPQPEDLAALETAINRAWFRWALDQLSPRDPNEQLVRQMVQRQIDLANVKSALDHVRHRGRGEEMDRLDFLPGGLLEIGKLDQVAGAPSMIAAFTALEGTYFAPGIEKGILAFGGGGSLGVMERFLEQVVIGIGCRLFRLDPLSAAVPLGFIWRKVDEFLNLRILVRGKAYGMPLASIREEMRIA